MLRVPTKNRSISTFAAFFFLTLLALNSVSLAQGDARDPKKGSARSSSELSEPEWLTWIAKSGSTKSNSWFPSWGASKQKSIPPSYSKNNKTTWQKMSQTSKRWWEKTKDVLDPYPPPKYPSAASKSKGSNWFSGWFEPKSDKKIESVPDFLRQETPK